jgi:hypothetical protein
MLRLFEVACAEFKFFLAGLHFRDKAYCTLAASTPNAHSQGLSATGEESVRVLASHPLG